MYTRSRQDLLQIELRIALLPCRGRGSSLLGSQSSLLLRLPFVLELCPCLLVHLYTLNTPTQSPSQACAQKQVNQGGGREHGT